MIAVSKSAEDRLLTVAETCSRTRLSKSKINELLIRGIIASCKLDRRRLVSSASVERFIADALAVTAASIER